MITYLPDDVPATIPEDFYRRASVQEYLWAIETYAPGWNIPADRAIALGLAIVHRARQGYLHDARALGVRHGYDLDELDVMIAAAFTWLSPGDLPDGLREVDPENTFGLSGFAWSNDDEPDARSIHDEGLAEDA